MPDEASQLCLALRTENLARFSVEVHPLQLILDKDLAGLLRSELLFNGVVLSDVLVQKEQLAARSATICFRHLRCEIKEYESFAH